MVRMRASNELYVLLRNPQLTENDRSPTAKLGNSPKRPDWSFGGSLLEEERKDLLCLQIQSISTTIFSNSFLYHSNLDLIRDGVGRVGRKTP